ncbi:MAG TPA: alanyl-tRNA editing protein [bacterium]|nr:alanyl-tRNA editing protein [bacterium]
MSAKLLYLEDSYKKTIESKIVAVEAESEGKWKVALEETIFYPLGGGQPTDQGTMKSDSWEGKVYLALMKDGDVWHHVQSESEPKVGETVTGELNWDRRYKNMKVHSAGHIIDFGIHALGYSPESLMPVKGDHGKKAFIEYAGKTEKGNDELRKEIEDKANELVKQDLAFSIKFMSLEELEKETIYLQPGLPSNKPLRALTLEGIGTVADGGTQVKKTSEVGKIIIKDLTVEDGSTILKYGIE